MGCLHGVAEISGFEHLFPPFIAAVISDSELMQWLLIHCNLDG